MRTAALLLLFVLCLAAQSAATTPVPGPDRVKVIQTNSGKDVQDYLQYRKKDAPPKGKKKGLLALPSTLGVKSECQDVQPGRPLQPGEAEVPSCKAVIKPIPVNVR